MEKKREVTGRFLVMDKDMQIKLLALLTLLTRELIRFLFLSGSRVHEAIRIKVGDADLNAGTVTINGKNGGPVTILVVPRDCVPYMAWRIQTATSLLEPLFCREDGSPFNVNTLRHEWRAACKALGLGEVGIYITRATFAARIADTAAGDIGKLMGHTSIKSLTKKGKKSG